MITSSFGLGWNITIKLHFLLQIYKNHGKKWGMIATCNLILGPQSHLIKGHLYRPNIGQTSDTSQSLPHVKGPAISRQKGKCLFISWGCRMGETLQINKPQNEPLVICKPKAGVEPTQKRSRMETFDPLLCFGPTLDFWFTNTYQNVTEASLLMCETTRALSERLKISRSPSTVWIIYRWRRCQTTDNITGPEIVY